MSEAPSGERALALRVEGQVQGVGYRAFTQAEARRAGVTGWVVNRDDGAVEAVISGPGQALALLVGILRKGPPVAIVDKLDVQSTDRRNASEAPEGALRF